jgi:FAD/FMN-containing dehydrogenase
MTLATAQRPTADLVALRAALAGIEVIDDPAQVKLKSRDFYWYSPILKPLLRDKSADLVLIPRDEAEVVRIARACARHRVPAVVRGGGTGNYGQLVPLQGGVVIEMTAMNAVRWLKPGLGRFEAGARLIDIDTATRPQGWELRMHPSTKRMATIGGFIAGGAAGVGSITWGQLRDPGAIMGLRVVTMEEEPRILEFRGKDLAKVTHAYGTNGILTEVEMPMAPAWPWCDFIVTFPQFMQAARFGQALGEADGIVKNLASAMAWPIPTYFKPLRKFLPDGQSIVIALIAEPSLEAFKLLVQQHGGNITFERAPGAADDEIGPLYEYTWNHTTLQALKVDRTLTYLQSIFTPGKNLVQVDQMYALFGDEVMLHLEFQRRLGRVSCSALQVVRFTTPERLAEIMRIHEANGVRISNPHSYILEDKGPKVIDADHQLAFKREADPYGLMNPGKMSRWSQA